MNMLCKTNRFKRGPWRALLVGVLMIPLAGCTTQKISTATFTSAGTGVHHEQQRLSIEVEAVTNPTVLKDLFGTDNLGKGVLAVHVRVSNTSDSKSFIVQPENFRLGTLDSGSIKRKSEGGETTVMLGTGATMATAVFIPAIVVGAPLLFAGLANVSNASIVQHNLMEREFKSATLSKGDTSDGFIYFRFPEAVSHTNEVLEVTTIEAGNGTPVKFQFNLNR
jgi:hypothetical protein